MTWRKMPASSPPQGGCITVILIATCSCDHCTVWLVQALHIELIVATITCGNLVIICIQEGNGFEKIGQRII